jgi:hypothetical protein
MSGPDLKAAGLDDLAKQFEGETGIEQVEEIEDAEIVEEEEAKPSEDDAPPGYQNYEEWIAAGKDPDDYKGKNAYKAEYERIQDNKELKAKLQETNDLVRSVVDAAEATKAQQQKEYKEELERKLAEHKKNYEVDDAIETQKELDKLNSQPVQAPQLNPVVSEFLTDNPLLDETNSQFNSEFFGDFEAIYTSKLDSLTANRTRPVTDAQVQRALKAAHNEAKSLNPELFKSARNGRQQAVGKQNNGKSSKSLSDYKIDDNDDPRNQSAATAMYEMIKKKDPEQAEQFRKNLLGE